MTSPPLRTTQACPSINDSFFTAFLGHIRQTYPTLTPAAVAIHEAVLDSEFQLIYNNSDVLGFYIKQLNVFAILPDFHYILRQQAIRYAKQLAIAKADCTTLLTALTSTN